MSSDYVWVVGFDASTGKAMQFIRCHKNSAPFHESLYACEGYSVQTMTSEEFGELADRGVPGSGSLPVSAIDFSVPGAAGLSAIRFAGGEGDQCSSIWILTVTWTCSTT